MNIVEKAGKGSFAVIVGLGFLLIVGMIFPFIPLLGSMSTFIGGLIIQYLLILFVIMLLISVLLYRKRRSKFNAVLMIAAGFTFAASMFIMIHMVSVVNKAGAKVNFFKSYSLAEPSAVTTKTMTYTVSEVTENDVKLEIFYMDDNVGNKPVIMYIHGGGWISGNRTQRSNDSITYAQNGYVVVSVDYDLSTSSEHYWDKTETQLLKAISWVQTNIADYGGNVDAFYMTGDSAGGNLALELSYKINSGLYSESENGQLPMIDAVSVNYPVASPKSFYENNDLMCSTISKKMAGSYVGGSPEEYAERYEAIQPCNYITENTPPTLIIVGKCDTLVPPEETYSLAEELERNGIETKLVKVPYANHCFDILRNNIGDQALINLTLDWFND